MLFWLHSSSVWARNCPCRGKKEKMAPVFYLSSVTQSCPTPCDPMECSIPDFPDHHQLLKLSQPHIHQVGDAIQLAHPLSSTFPPAFNLSQYQGLFQWVSWYPPKCLPNGSHSSQGRKLQHVAGSAPPTGDHSTRRWATEATLGMSPKVTVTGNPWWKWKL